MISVSISTLSCCKTDSVRDKKKLFKDLQEGATSAGLYLHNIL